MIAAFNDKGYVKDDDDDEDDFDNIDDPEDEVYEEEGEQDFEEDTDKIEPPAKKQKKEVIIIINNSKVNKKTQRSISSKLRTGSQSSAAHRGVFVGSGGQKDMLSTQKRVGVSFSLFGD